MSQSESISVEQHGCETNSTKNDGAGDVGVVTLGKPSSVESERRV